MSKQKIFTTALSVLITALFVGAMVYAAPWTPPTANPPANNADEPLNKGVDYQEKLGGLTVGAGSGLANGLIVLNGNVGIGTTSPNAKLFVSGGSYGTTGASNQAAYALGASSIGADTSIYSYGSVCTGNSSGRCTGDGGVVVGEGNANASVNITSDKSFFKGGNVGIGTIFPSAKLEVQGKFVVAKPTMTYKFLRTDTSAARDAMEKCSCDASGQRDDCGSGEFTGTNVGQACYDKDGRDYNVFTRVEGNILEVSGDGNIYAGGNISANDVYLVKIKKFASQLDVAPDPNIADADSDGYNLNQGDCNDNDASVFPDALLQYNSGKDADCNGRQEGAYVMPVYTAPNASPLTQIDVFCRSKIADSASTQFDGYIYNASGNVMTTWANASGRFYRTYLMTNGVSFLAASGDYDGDWEDLVDGSCPLNDPYDIYSGCVPGTEPAKAEWKVWCN